MKSPNGTIPPGTGQSWDSSLRLLHAAENSEIPPVVAGFDGFVDTILHVVSERRSATEYTRVPTLQAFSEKVLAAAGGRNMNIEMVPRLTKIGGNGPILANALAHFDIPVTYIGRLGSPVLHPVSDVLAYSKELRELLRIDGVVIHWSRYAAGNDSDSAACVEAPFTDNPKISTGAGDHFNAGFCLGRLLRGDMNLTYGLA